MTTKSTQVKYVNKFGFTWTGVGHGFVSVHLFVSV